MDRDGGRIGVIDKVTSSNGVEVFRLALPNCENCGIEPAVIELRITGAPFTRRVCRRCLIANDGRTGWPIYSDLTRTLAASTTA
jgi:hypothetical protein